MKIPSRCSAVAALALSILLSLPTAEAKGLLGDRYLAYVYEYIEIEDADGWTLGLDANFPLVADNNAWGLDASLAGSYGEIWDEDAENFGASITFFSKNLPFANLFARASVANEHLSFYRTDEDTLVLGGMLGAEFELGDNVALTPYYQYIDIDEYGQGEDVFGLDFAYWLTEETSFSLGYYTTSDNSIRIDTFAFVYRAGF